MPLDPMFRLTESQIDCINTNLKAEVDLRDPGMRAGRALGIHGVYGQREPKEITENDDYFSMLKMAGVPQRARAMDEDGWHTVPDGMFTLVQEDIRTMRAAGTPTWMLEKLASVSKEPVQRALDRMADAFERGGAGELIKATAQRVKKTKDSDKLQGIVMALEKVIVSAASGTKNDLFPGGLSQPEVKQLRAIQAAAKAAGGGE